jgi:predicted transcriptional regulator
VTWSYDLLRDAERHVFCRLSVFADDFSLEGAEAVVSGPPVMENDVLDVLTRLVEKSLVVTTTSSGAYRYRLLETLRQYGTERLLEADELAQWRSRLLDWAMTLVADVERSLRTPRQDAAIARAVPEQANLRSALAWARELGDTESALRIVAAVPIGLISERRQLICDVLDEAATSGEIEAGLAGRAWSALANIALEQSDWAFGIDAAQRGAASYHRAGLLVHQAWAELLEMWLQWGVGNHESVDEAAGRIAQQFRDLNDDFGLGYTLWVASLRVADLDEAAAMAAEADRLLRRSGSPVGVAHNVEGRAIIAFDRGELAAAAGFAAEAVKLFSGSVSYGCTAHALEVAAVVVAADDDHDRRVPAELLSAAEMFRDISGQGHRPWEIRARHGGTDYLDLHSTADFKAAGRRHTLASAASMAIDALGGAGAT